MKTLIHHIYSFSELDETAKENAIFCLQDAAAEDPYLLEHVSHELTESLKSICQAFGLRLMDYSFGTCDRGHKVEVSSYHAEDLSGRRACAWFLRGLLRHGYSRPARFREMTFPGVCGFTGVCYDEDILETVWESLLDGSTVRQAFDSVSGKLCSILEAEENYLTSPAAIREMLDESFEQFDVEGSLI